VFIAVVYLFSAYGPLNLKQQNNPEEQAIKNRKKFDDLVDSQIEDRSGVTQQESDIEEQAIKNRKKFDDLVNQTEGVGLFQQESDTQQQAIENRKLFDEIVGDQTN